MVDLEPLQNGGRQSCTAISVRKKVPRFRFSGSSLFWIEIAGSSGSSVVGELKKGSDSFGTP